MTATGDVATMARQIERLVERPAWQQDAQIKGDLMKVLGRLTTVRVDVDLLKNTGIGKWVKKLTKYDDDVVRGYSASLTDKWKAQVGVASGGGGGSGGDKPAKARPQQQTQPAPAPSPTNGPDRARFENARKNLQDKYAAEKAKREARTVQMINRPVGAKRRGGGTTISAAPSRSTLAARVGITQRRALPASGRSVSTSRTVTPPPVRRMLGSAGQSRSASAPPADSDEVRRRRRERLLALAQQGQANGSSSRDLLGPSSSSSQNRRVPSQKSPSARSAPPPQQPVDPRKAMLDRMIPRVCGVAAETTKTTKKPASGTQGSKASSGSKKKPVNHSEGQRDVIQWLKGLDVDMSSYADAFFDNGFDSIKLLNEIKSRDLETMVPKAGHQRMIEKALNDLKRKHATAASSRPRSATRDRDRDRDLPRRKPRPDSYFDEDSDDSFVVSDGDEYAPGAITAMFRKGRKRRYSIDSTDSYNMEASYTEIQNEEERSKRIGEYEDYREELRNKNLLKKKK